jgi:hypothetical protein
MYYGSDNEDFDEKTLDAVKMAVDKVVELVPKVDAIGNALAKILDMALDFVDAMSSEEGMILRLAVAHKLGLSD